MLFPSYSGQLVVRYGKIHNRAIFLVVRFAKGVDSWWHYYYDNYVSDGSMDYCPNNYYYWYNDETIVFGLYPHGDN